MPKKHEHQFKICAPAIRPNGAALSGAAPLPSTAETPSRHSVETATAATCSRWKPFMACNHNQAPHDLGFCPCCFRSG